MDGACFNRRRRAELRLRGASATPAGGAEGEVWVEGQWNRSPFATSDPTLNWESSCPAVRVNLRGLGNDAGRSP